MLLSSLLLLNVYCYFITLITYNYNPKIKCDQRQIETEHYTLIHIANKWLKKYPGYHNCSLYHNIAMNNSMNEQTLIYHNVSAMDEYKCQSSYGIFRNNYRYCQTEICIYVFLHLHWQRYLYHFSISTRFRTILDLPDEQKTVGTLYHKCLMGSNVFRYWSWSMMTDKATKPGGTNICTLYTYCQQSNFTLLFRVWTMM